jgi:glycosyltransferase involved in cell wall biosynthesis
MRRLVSIVIPCFNEAGSIAMLADALWPPLEKIPELDWEVICIDDGSTDSTLQELIALSRRDERFRVLELSRNFGKEAALTAGLDMARGDAVIPMDADLQDPPALIEQMVSAWDDGAEVVLARRSNRASDGVLKRRTAAWFYHLHNRMSDTKIPENVGDFRLMDRVVVDALKRLPERQRFMKGLFAWVGYRTQVIDYVRPPRSTGDTKFSGLRLWQLALEGVTGFSTMPLKIWTYVGAAGALSTLAYAIFTIVKTIVLGISVHGYASLLVAILFFGSVQLMSIGLLGEYIGRIYLETKQRPTYLIRRTYGGSGAASRHEYHGRAVQAAASALDQM